jgi:4-amino-4-deoxy-L-arabinose transferase-like glycosyltransferase
LISTRNRPILLLFLGLLVLNVAGTWSLPLVDRDEPRFAEASREMIERGDYVVPWFNNRERFDKPPLIYWLQIAAYQLFGENEFAARLPGSVAAALTAVVIALWGRRQYGAVTGIRAALIFALCLQLFVHARASVADMPMVLAVTAAAWGGWEWLRGERRAVAGALFWVLLALGFLAKGPIALVPIGMVAAAARWRGSGRTSALAWSGGLLLMLALIGSWGVPALFRTNGEFAAVGLGKHVVARSFSPMEGHGASGLAGYVASLPFYFLTIFGSLFPWSIWLFPAARALRRREARGDLENYLLIGTALVFAIFTLSRTKLPHYTMPAFPFIALLLAGWWRDHRTSRLFNRTAAAAAAVSLLLALALFPAAARYFPSEQLHVQTASLLPAEAEFGAVGYQEPSLVWAFRKTISGFMTELRPEEAAAYMDRPGPRFLVLRDSDMPKIFPQGPPAYDRFIVDGYQVAKGRRVRLTLLLKRS